MHIRVYFVYSTTIYDFTLYTGTKIQQQSERTNTLGPFTITTLNKHISIVLAWSPINFNNNLQHVTTFCICGGYFQVPNEEKDAVQKSKIWLLCFKKCFSILVPSWKYILQFSRTCFISSYGFVTVSVFFWVKCLASFPLSVSPWTQMALDFTLVDEIVVITFSDDLQSPTNKRKQSS